MSGKMYICQDIQTLVIDTLIYNDISECIFIPLVCKLWREEFIRLTSHLKNAPKILFLKIPENINLQNVVNEVLTDPPKDLINIEDNNLKQRSDEFKNKSSYEVMAMLNFKGDKGGNRPIFRKREYYEIGPFFVSISKEREENIKYRDKDFGNKIEGIPFYFRIYWKEDLSLWKELCLGNQQVLQFSYSDKIFLLSTVLLENSDMACLHAYLVHILGDGVHECYNIPNHHYYDIKDENFIKKGNIINMPKDVNLWYVPLTSDYFSCALKDTIKVWKNPYFNQC